MWYTHTHTQTQAERASRCGSRLSWQMQRRRQRGLSINKIDLGSSPFRLFAHGTVLLLFFTDKVALLSLSSRHRHTHCNYIDYTRTKTNCMEWGGKDQCLFLYLEGSVWLQTRYVIDKKIKCSQKSSRHIFLKNLGIVIACSSPWRNNGRCLSCSRRNTVGNSLAIGSGTGTDDSREVRQEWIHLLFLRATVVNCWLYKIYVQYYIINARSFSEDKISIKKILGKIILNIDII